MFRHHKLFLLATLICSTTGCGGAHVDRVRVPLLGDRQVAYVLTEGPRLELPPSTSGNRFLSG